MRELRNKAKPWESKTTIFWRGTTTGNKVFTDGLGKEGDLSFVNATNPAHLATCTSLPHSLRDGLPRVEVARKSHELPWMDVKLTNLAQVSRHVSGPFV